MSSETLKELQREHSFSKQHSAAEQPINYVLCYFWINICRGYYVYLFSQKDNSLFNHFVILTQLHVFSMQCRSLRSTFLLFLSDIYLSRNSCISLVPKNVSVCGMCPIQVDSRLISCNIKYILHTRTE